MMPWHILSVVDLPLLPPSSLRAWWPSLMSPLFPCCLSPLCLPLQTRGCEAHAALCAKGSALAQCSSPGPIPNLPKTDLIKDGIDVSTRNHPAPLLGVLTWL